MIKDFFKIADQSICCWIYFVVLDAKPLHHLINVYRFIFFEAGEYGRKCMEFCWINMLQNTAGKGAAVKPPAQTSTNRHIAPQPFLNRISQQKIELLHDVFLRHFGKLMPVYIPIVHHMHFETDGIQQQIMCGLQ